MPGTPSGVNHSSESQKCGLNAVSPRSSSSRCSSAIRSESTLCSIVTPSWHIFRSRSFSSGQSAHSSGGSTPSVGISTVYKPSPTPLPRLFVVYPCANPQQRRDLPLRAGAGAHSGVSDMTFPARLACALALFVAGAPRLFAQQSAPQTTDPQTAPKAEQTPAAQKPAGPKPEQKPDEPQKYEETVVVSASKTEEKLINAPATMSVIGSQTIETAPTQNFAELLRAIPGMNITQVSARDINVTARGATGTLATGQLAVLDGRSLYQDFFGFVMWDFLPVNLNEIKQIEVIRGPASAVWGANALNGVINVITKSPREMQGTSAVLGVGGFDRANGEDTGSLWYLSGTHAQAINDRWAFKLS